MSTLTPLDFRHQQNFNSEHFIEIEDGQIFPDYDAIDAFADQYCRQISMGSDCGNRYWLISANMEVEGVVGITNFGFVSNNINPLNNNHLKKHVENRSDVADGSVVIINIVEFDNEIDYINFWS